MFEDFHVEIDDMLHADGQRVVTSIHDGGRMPGRRCRRPEFPPPRLTIRDAYVDLYKEGLPDE
jgi:hypothetical protein